jgi:hypothetical protein
MPIRLNLLAELQAAEEVRRRNPVKRVIWVAALLVCLMLVWWSSLQLQAMVKRSELNQISLRMDSKTNEFQTLLDSQKKILDVTHKLASLQQLATNRFLNGSLLNALQYCTVDGIQVLHLKVNQSYTVTDEVKPKTGDNGRTIPGRPASVNERISMILDAKDSSPNPGDLMITRFRQAIATNSYFLGFLGRTNEVKLTKYSPPQTLQGEPTFVLFTVQCDFPEKTR